MSDYVKYTLAAAAMACAHAGLTDGVLLGATASLLGTTHGSAAFSRAYYRQIVDEGLTAANPSLFAEGVPNAAAAQLSLMLGLRGAGQTIIGTRTAGLDALRLAALRIETGACERVIVSAAEENFETVNRAYEHLGGRAGCTGTIKGAGGAGSPAFGGARGFRNQAGAVALVVESIDSAARRGATVLGRVRAASAASGPPGRIVRTLCQALTDMPAGEAVMSSASGSAFDRAEALALRAWDRERDGSGAGGTSAGRPRVDLREMAGTNDAGPVVSSVADAVGEMFSVTPLVGLAAALLTGRLPAVHPGAAATLRPMRASAGEGIDGLILLSSDPAGLATAVAIGVGDGDDCKAANGCADLGGV